MGEKVAGAARGSRPAGEKRQRYSAETAHSHEAVAWSKLRKGLRKLKGRRLRITVDVKPTGQALLDPIFGSYVVQMMLECAQSAILGGKCECHGCKRRWTPDRAMVAVGMVQFVDIAGSAGLVGLCRQCCANPDRLTVVADGFKRDFGLTSVEVRAMAAGGRA